MNIEKLAKVLEFLLKDSNFISFHPYKIEKGDDLYVLYNPGAPRFFRNLTDLSNILIKMLKEDKKDT